LKSFHQIILEEYFEPTIGKAIRVMLALVLPLIWGMLTGHMTPAVWIAISAQVLSSVNVRGSYPLKLLVLSGAVAACAVAAALGTLAGAWWAVAALLMAALAFIGGFVRQSGDHGPGITLAVLLLYLLTLDSPGGFRAAGDLFLWVLEGGLLALLSTLANWAFTPFDPFRRSIAMTWKTLAEWLHLLSRHLRETGEGRYLRELDEKELALRAELNDSMETLSRRQAIAHARQNRYAYRLVELRRLASLAGGALSSLRVTAEQILREQDFPDKLFQYALENMRIVAQRLGICIVTNKAEDAYGARIAVERLKQNLSVLYPALQTAPLASAAPQLRVQLDDMVGLFEEALALLEKSAAGKGTMTFFLQNFLTGMTIPQRIPMVRFEFSPRSFVFRFSVRLALGMGLGIAVYKYFQIPHGYWIAMTTMIVLQPEFGATMTKAFNRMKGTVLGVIAGSLIFLLALPLPVNVAIVVVCTFFMTYFVQRNYAVAAFFITVMVIALFHLLEPVTWQLGIIRLVNTLAGCGVAMLGGYAFWPLWERFRFPALMARALAANRAYLTLILDTLARGGKITFDEFIRFRREAEMTNNNAFVCLRRMENEPRPEKKDLEQFFIITGHNIRLTRLINALNQHMRDAPRPVRLPEAAAFEALARGMLSDMAEAMAKGPGAAPRRPAEALAAEVKPILGAAAGAEEVSRDLLERIAREAIGMYHFVREFSLSRPLPAPQAG
jgi:uncharacterized membrane protein YccC